MSVSARVLNPLISFKAGFAINFHEAVFLGLHFDSRHGSLSFAVVVAFFFTPFCLMPL